VAKRPAEKLIADVEANGKNYDNLVAKHSEEQIQNDSMHEGVPNFAFRNEPLFGQDRMERQCQTKMA